MVFIPSDEVQGQPIKSFVSIEGKENSWHLLGRPETDVCLRGRMAQGAVVESRTAIEFSGQTVRNTGIMVKCVGLLEGKPLYSHEQPALGIGLP